MARRLHQWRPRPRSRLKRTTQTNTHSPSPRQPCRGLFVCCLRGAGRDPLRAANRWRRQFSSGHARDSVVPQGMQRVGSVVRRHRQPVSRRSLDRGWSRDPGQARRLPLIVASLVIWTPLAACSHSSSTAYPLAGQASAAPPPGLIAPATSVTPPPPDEYEQARAGAYPSVTLAEALRHSAFSSTAAPSAASPPPPGPAPTTSVAPSGLANPAVVSSAPPYGAAPAPAAAATPQSEQDEALTSAYPSISLSDIIAGRSH